MKIQKINNISNKVFSQKVSTPIEKANTPKNSQILGNTAMALSGIYLTLKAVQEKKEKETLLKNTGFHDNLISRCLQNPNLGKKEITILFETAQLEDKSFFNYAIKNIDKIELINKKNSANFCCYSMSAKTKEGNINVEYTSLGILNIMGKNGDILNKTSRYMNKNNLQEYTKIYDGNKLISNFMINYDKDRNIISRTSYIQDTNFKKQFTEFSFSNDGIIQSVGKVDYDYQKDSDNHILITAVNKIRDFENKSVSILNSDEDLNKITSQIKIYRNPVTQKMESLVIKPSDVQGIYNSEIIDESGNKRIESKGTKDKDGNIFVEKHLESLDGTKTKYTYKTSGNNAYMHYQVVTKEGEVLTTVDRTFKKFNENLYYSSINGHEYLIEHTDNEIIVTDELLKNKTKIKKSDLYFNSQSEKMGNNLFSKMSGDMILDFYNRGYKYHYVADITDFNANTKDKIISCDDNIFNFAHELGHAKDSCFDENLKEHNVIVNNPIFQQAYNEESTAFTKNFSTSEQNYIKYFIDKITHYQSNNGHIQETAAEINALLSTEPAGCDKMFWIREYYLQKYFPKTIAAASKILNPNANIQVK
jgi:hypothetical protein